SPYERRIIGALVRLGRRQSAFELAQFFLGDRRPPAWHQWPEIAWRDPRSPGHIGDMPHTWIAAEFVLAFRSMLAFEREADQALVVAAGIPAEWLEADGGVGVDGLPTWYGTLGFTMRGNGDAVDMDLTLTGDVMMPPGGIGDRVEDDGGYFFYLRDLDSGRFWSSGLQPVRDPGAICRAEYRPACVSLLCDHERIEARLDVTVSPGDDLEIRRIRVRNRS